MSDIAKGRAQFLQDEVVKAIKIARLTMSEGDVKEIFGYLMDDATINSKVNGVDTKGVQM